MISVKSTNRINLIQLFMALEALLTVPAKGFGGLQKAQTSSSASSLHSSSIIKRRFHTRQTMTCIKRSISTQPSLTETETSVLSPAQRIFEMYPIDHLESLRQDNREYWTVHFIRHAQGTHNVNKEYRDIKNLDARLTSLGFEQCASLNQQLLNTQVRQPLLVVTSTMTRCIQTALNCFPHLVENTPFVAHENIRETVNYACDRRRPISHIAEEFPVVDFSHVPHDHDPIWDSYEQDPRLIGDNTQIHGSRRESAELYKVAERGRLFFEWLFQFPQVNQDQSKEVVVCSHSAFFRCIFGWGQSNGGVLHSPPQTLDDRPVGSPDVPVFSYNGLGDSFEMQMRQDFQNCEMRSCLIALPVEII